MKPGRILIYCLAPEHPIGWPVLRAFWCALIAAVTLLLEFDQGLLEHAGLIVATTAPLMLAVLWVTRHLVDIRERLTNLASHDPPTGIPNRRAPFKEMEPVDEGTIPIIDADHFKSINDTCGRGAGDSVLRRFAHDLHACARADDLVGRLGGEAFATFLKAADEGRARAIGVRTAEGLIVNDELTTPLHVALSVGGAHSCHAGNASNLVNLADKALCAVKDAWRARLAMWPHIGHSEAA